jgi:hypothetical protein
METKGTVFRAKHRSRFEVCAERWASLDQGGLRKGLAHQIFAWAVEVFTLKSSIRLIKRRVEQNHDLGTGQAVQRTHRQDTREIISTVKGWIAELEQRHRSEERRAAAFLK